MYLVRSRSPLVSQSTRIPIPRTHSKCPNSIQTRSKQYTNSVFTRINCNRYNIEISNNSSNRFFSTGTNGSNGNGNGRKNDSSNSTTTDSNITNSTSTDNKSINNTSQPGSRSTVMDDQEFDDRDIEIEIDTEIPSHYGNPTNNPNNTHMSSRRQQNTSGRENESEHEINTENNENNSDTEIDIGGKNSTRNTNTSTSKNASKSSTNMSTSSNNRSKSPKSTASSSRSSIKRKSNSAANNADNTNISTGSSNTNNTRSTREEHARPSSIDYSRVHSGTSGMSSIDSLGSVTSGFSRSHIPVARPQKILVIPYSSKSSPVFPHCYFTAPAISQQNQELITRLKRKHMLKGNTEEPLLVGLFMRNDDHKKDHFNKNNNTSSSTSTSTENTESKQNSTTTSNTSDTGTVEPLSRVHRVGLLCSVLLDGESHLHFYAHRRITAESLVTSTSATFTADFFSSEQFEPNLSGKPFLANITHHDDNADSNDLLDPELIELSSEIKEKIHFLRDSEGYLFQFRMQYLQNFNFFDISNLGQLGDYAASLLIAKSTEIQSILSEINVKKRLKLVVRLIDRNIAILKTQNSIQNNVNSIVKKKNSELIEKFLQEKKAEIDTKLGDNKSSKEVLLAKFKKAMESKVIPADITKVINDEMIKLSSMDSENSEFQLSRNYLEWLTSLPYSVMSTDNTDIMLAERTLNEHHYGLKEIKNRILEFIATLKLNGKINKIANNSTIKQPNSTSANSSSNNSTGSSSVISNQGKILCFVGPPGVGKTSIGKSIAAALNRKFYRLSVGGLDDVSEIKGHRRTYIGSLPGKIIHALKQCQTSNPVILIDEIDKMGRGYRGDPSSALLEVLDPEQNSNFIDYFVDCPIDLSSVLFVCTANTLDTIPSALADRMDFITIGGYTHLEKLHIVREYLMPSIERDTGIKPGTVRMSDETILALVKLYAREAGVRGLKKQLDKIYRKIALKLAKSTSSKSASDTATGANVSAIDITSDDLIAYLGLPKYSNDTIYNSRQSLPVGVSHGLGWSSDGGESIFIECTLAEPLLSHSTSEPLDPNALRGSLVMTGSLGAVMRESVSIAYTVAKHEFSLLQPLNPFFNLNKIHLHIPSGALNKDGPSAGGAIVTALLSLALNQPVQVQAEAPGRHDTSLYTQTTNISTATSPSLPRLAMTGELTLTGKILPVGGIKEKILAAKRAEVTDLILPEENQRDFDEIDQELKQGIKVHFVREYKQIREIAFPNTNTQNKAEILQANTITPSTNKTKTQNQTV